MVRQRRERDREKRNPPKEQAGEALYRLTPALRRMLKQPLGVVVRDLKDLVRHTKSKTFTELVRKLDAKGPIICVGDETCDRVLSYGIEPKIIIYDQRIGRKEIGLRDSIRAFDAQPITVTNHPGTLSEEALSAVSRAVTRRAKTKIFVQGEEDLVALAAIYAAPLGSTVLYGQPGERKKNGKRKGAKKDASGGIVVVYVDRYMKERVGWILEDMAGDARHPIIRGRREHKKRKRLKQHSYAVGDVIPVPKGKGEHSAVYLGRSRRGGAKVRISVVHTPQGFR